MAGVSGPVAEALTASPGRIAGRSETGATPPVATGASASASVSCASMRAEVMSVARMPLVLAAAAGGGLDCATASAATISSAWMGGAEAATVVVPGRIAGRRLDAMATRAGAVLPAPAT